MRKLALLIVIVATIVIAQPGSSTAQSTASATTEPTITPTAGPTLTPTASPTWEPTPQGAVGTFNFPPNVNPLTGEVVADPAVLQRRPLAVNISNAPPLGRPQAGIGDADR